MKKIHLLSYLLLLNTLLGIASTRNQSRVIIPDSAKEKPLKGEVIAVGNGTKDEEMVVKPGDCVLYGKYAGTEIELDNDKFLIMRQSDILAIL